MPANKAIRKMAIIMTYAMVINVFFVLVEVFTVSYARIPEHVEHFEYLYCRVGEFSLAPWMWISAWFAVAALAILLTPAWRNRMLPLGLRTGFHLALAGKGPGLDRRRF